MRKQEIQKEWKKLSSEITENKPDIEGPYPSDIVRNRELLLLGQVLLGKIEARINIEANVKIYCIIMKHYFQQKNV